jgi:ABC-2 type transport system permease protein
VLLVGNTLFDAEMVWGTLPGSIVTVIVGVACFCLLGLAVTPAVPTADAALPVAYGTFLPVAFISDVFFPADTSPPWLRGLAAALPLRPFARSLQANFTPGATGLGFHWPELGVMAAWTAGSTVVAAITFRWHGADQAHRARARAGARVSGRRAASASARSRR